MMFYNLKAKGFMLTVVLFATVSISGIYETAICAEKYPTREIELVINYAAGGQTDAMARIVGERVSKYLGVPIVPVNKPGASGVLGASFVSNSTPDGYTVGTSGASNLGSVMATQNDVPYTSGDFAAIARAVKLDLIFVVKKGRFSSFQDVIKEEKQKPGSLTYASWGAKSISHMAGELVNLEMGIKMQHVPFTGGAKALAAVLGGHVDVIISTLSTCMPNIRAGNLACLAIASDSRVGDLPQIPTIKELGYPEVVIVGSDGFVTGSKVPKERLAIIRAAFEKSIKDPDIDEALKKAGMIPAYLSGENYQKWLASNLAVMEKIAAKAGIMKD